MKKHNGKLKIYKTGIEVARAFAEELEAIANQNKTTLHIALSGGSTPAILFDVLAKDYADSINWDQIHFWWGDERCVTPTDDQSNYKMANNLLFNPLNIKSANIHRIKGELLPQDACNDYIESIKNTIPSEKGIPVFDMIILGMGSDGHTASIFPNQIELLDSSAICEVATHPESGQKRVTLTGQVINQAKNISFLVTGESKAERIRQIINEEPDASKFPAFHIQPLSGSLTFYLDIAAAQFIN